MNQNQDFFPWDDIPDSNVFPTMTGQFRFDKLEDGVSQSTNKRMFRAQFTCVAPEQYAGMAHFENYVTGNDENLGGIIPGSMGTRQMKQALSAAQVPPQTSTAAVCALIEASKPQLMISISHYTEKSGEYKGQERNRIVGYHKIGEKKVEIAPVLGQAPMGTVAPPAPGGVQAAPAPAAPPVAPAAAPAPAPVQQAPVQQAPAPAPETPAPVAPAAPATPPPTAAPAPPAAAAPATPVQQLACNICGNQVPIDQYSAHVQRHQTDPSWNGVG